MIVFLLSRIALYKYVMLCQASVTLPSGLCIDKWGMYLEQYDLKTYLQFDFLLNIDCQLFTISEVVVYHASVITKSDGLDKYCEYKLDNGARVGPFYKITFDKLHTFPLMACSKHDGGTRFIVDLSWP